MKSGFVAIIGRPNVGKSTLLNSILGEKVAIVSDKPQTTRNHIRGIYTEQDYQIIFIDTPGIHKPKNKLGSFMLEMAENSLNEVELVLFLVDDSLTIGPGDRYILDLLAKIKTPKYLLINKIDKMTPDGFKSVYDQYASQDNFDEIFGISAISGDNVKKLVEAIKTKLPDGPQYFPSDIITDHPERFIITEIIREKLLHYLEFEVPHGVAVEIETYSEEKDITKIGAIIYCEKKSHKGIIIGKDGKKLKGIGKSARIEIEALLGIKVFLELWVKVKENWRESDFLLNSFGYKK
ncbi:MAG: GTPase Era [Eubacteriales bacterium]